MLVPDPGRQPIKLPDPIFPHSPGPGPADESRLHQDLRHAIACNQLSLHFQPKVTLSSKAIVSAEALARWPHRRRGMVPPGTFIPLAERTGLVVPLGAWVLAAACAEALSWPGEIGLSVNASACQLANGVLLQQIQSALAGSGLTPERLEIELTESVIVNADIETLLTLSAIRDLGVGLALDDFGTGYASLSALKRLPLTTLKLDRSLVHGVGRHREDTAIVRAVIATGHALGLEIVAEGVEGEPQSCFLASLGCRLGQSFFLGRPAAADRFRSGLAGANPASSA